MPIVRLIAAQSIESIPHKTTDGKSYVSIEVPWTLGDSASGRAR